MNRQISKLSLGIDVGATSVKMCLMKGGQEQKSRVLPHDGDVQGTVRHLLKELRTEAGIPAVVTGHEGRRQFKTQTVIEAVAVEHALAELMLNVCAVVSVGGEDLVVYSVDEQGRIVNTYAGNKCASGTGEFFCQQLKRMGLNLDVVNSPEVARASAHPLSARCSVFMKSDCTHKLNKGESTKHDIVLSLSKVMSSKVLEFLGKAKITSGNVLLVGGCTQNPHFVRYIQEGLKGVTFIIPEQAHYLEAYGAALIARQNQSPLPAVERLFARGDVIFARGTPLQAARDLVTCVEGNRGTIRPGARYALGVDGGSTTTKVALIDMETREIVATHYGRTLGDPVLALKDCLEHLRISIEAQTGSSFQDLQIPLVATTGSSRELLGVFCGTAAVFNEIMAHTVGVTHFDPDIDTIFEIGGQDAKYVHLRNRVPIDYAMNEACSAGTGSFLEESAEGDLDIHRPEEIGPIALEAGAPLRFGEHCSAFINSDIRMAIQQGAHPSDIVAGLVLSVVSNYLNRVVGNRRIGEHIVLQGGVAKNPAVPMAFASILNKQVMVPPDPELMGAFGVALLAINKAEEGVLEPGSFNLNTLMEGELNYEGEFRCKACENLCPIRMIKVAGVRYPFGGRCNKYANARKRKPNAAEAKQDAGKEPQVRDYIEVRQHLYFSQYGLPSANASLPADSPTVAILDAFSVHSLWPLYANFFHNLGVRVKHITRVAENAAAKCESSYCYPAEIAHGLTETAMQEGADYLFLPHFKAMPSYEKDIHACLCPLTQGLPYYLRTAFGLEDTGILRPILDFSGGFMAGAEAMVQTAVGMGFSVARATEAFQMAVATQEACYREGRRIGREAIRLAEEEDRAIIALFGRSYNAFTKSANMGIPRKFSSRGYSILPFDFLPLENEEIYPNMYWYYGQQNMKAAVLVKNHPHIYPVFITNFSCAPDSFILHYLRWVYNTKPFLVLELDSHTADAGLDTRIEAFLDIMEGCRSAHIEEKPIIPPRDWNVRLEKNRAVVVNRHTQEERDLKHKDVVLLWPSMGQHGTKLISEISKSYGINSVALAAPDATTAARARAVASGKECIPALLVLGSFLEYFATNAPDPDKVYLLFMPITTGPCRTGQYAIFYQNLFQELGYKNVVVLSLNCDNSYAELGADFNRRAWVTICLADYLKDMENTLQSLALHPKTAEAIFAQVLNEALRAAVKGPRAIMAQLPRWARRLGQIPLKMPLNQAKKVLVVGEIYVRRDDFSVGTLMEGLQEQSIVGKVTGLTEWIHYLDFEQERKLRRELSAMSFRQALLSPQLRKLVVLRLEIAWKKLMESKILDPLSTSGLIPPSPHGMKRIMARAEEFTHPELESEATLSPCSAAVAMEEGYNGVAVIAPFACLPGRLIEALYGPWARERGLPVLCLENDGNPYPPNVLSRIEVFAHNVARGPGGQPTAGIGHQEEEVPCEPGSPIPKEGKGKARHPIRK